jgi:hypothetical protein
VAYHQHPNRETGEPPLERYGQELKFLRQVNLSEAIGFFHRREKRTVDRKYSDVRIDKLFFAVDPQLRGDPVIVHYDPFSQRDEVLLYSPAGQYLGRGRRYQREKGSHPTPEPAVDNEPIEPLYLQNLQEEHRRLQQQQRAQGVDYHSARQRNVWSLSSFANRFAQLLGRKGGASGLTAQEMEILSAFHARHDAVTETRLRQAFENAESKTIPTILFQLQQLLTERTP